ncbi:MULTISPECIES: hypothetical protein [Arthrobacter]|uniref:Glycine zipper 2TM domain-containing protein n=1 Tax=Arthrobacter nanjingensis TaxID=1387716 RepID=A0ABU9KN29_9MICC
MNNDDGRRTTRFPALGAWRRRASRVPGALRRALAPWAQRQAPERKPHRNGRGLFVGAVLGGILGYFAGRAIGQAAWGIVLGGLIGAAVLYRLNPGPRRK